MLTDFEILYWPFQNTEIFKTANSQNFLQSVKSLSNMPQAALSGNELVLCLNAFLSRKPIARKVAAGVQVINVQNLDIFEFLKLI